MAETLLEIADRAVAATLRAGASSADAIAVRSSATSVGAAGRRLEEAEGAEGLDLGLRALIGRRQACIAGSGTDTHTLAAMAAQAVAMAREAPEDPFCGLGEAPAPGGAGSEPGDLELTDPDGAPSPSTLEALALEAEAAALAIPGVVQVERADASASLTQIALAASNGFSGVYARSDRTVSVAAIAGEGLGRERDWALEGRRRFEDLPSPAEIGQRAGRRAVERLAPRKPPSGPAPVLYDRRVSAGLIGHVLDAINGTSVARGASWLRDAMGTAILPGGFDIVEDPWLLRGVSSRPFDAEGVATRRRLLVEDGVLRTWLLDLATARKLGLETTGNARRGTDGPPAPGPANVILENGARTRHDLIRDMGTGLIVTSMIGSSVNPATGAYSRGASGFWVEGGEIAYPVNEATVAGSLPEMIATMVRADDRDPHRALSAPSLLIEGATVGA